MPAAGRTPSLVLLGTDAVLAARPATPVQLAHACAALGHDGVAPMSWGDELVAEAALRRLASAHDGPAVLAACPCVARRVLQAGDELRPYLVALLPPPVALARYLRALWAPQEIRLTLVGACAEIDGDDFDARLTPAELLRSFEAAGIALLEQPQVYEEVIPPDRRRHLSLPGGTPAAEVLRAHTGRPLVELAGGDLARVLVQALLDDGEALVDPSPLLRCACAGASVEEPPRARAAVAALEPPRAASPVVMALRAELPLDVEPPHAARADAMRDAASGDAASGNAAMHDDLAPDERRVPSSSARPGLTTFDRRGGGLASLLAASAVPDDMPSGRDDRDPFDLSSFTPMRASTDAPRPADGAVIEPVLVADQPLMVVAPAEPAPAVAFAPFARDERPAPRRDEMETLRATAERALEPFIAQVHAAEAVEAPSALGASLDVARDRLPSADAATRSVGRPQEVVAEILVAREPAVAETPAARRAAAQAALVVDVEPPPTIKSIVAASRAARATGGTRAVAGPGVAVHAPMRRPAMVPAPRHPVARRVARNVGIVVAVAAAAAAVVAYAGAAGRALGALTALVR